jgi:imidazolonepropionase-like amidohydrolase
VAATANAAWALGLPSDAGRLVSDGRADVVVWNCRDWRELAYWYGMPLAWRVYAAGHPCHGPEAGLSSIRSGVSPLSPRSS